MQALEFIGRGERIRTFDPLVPNQMRYQAALRPDKRVTITQRGPFLSRPRLPCCCAWIRDVKPLRSE